MNVSHFLLFALFVSFSLAATVPASFLQLLTKIESDIKRFFTVNKNATSALLQQATEQNLLANPEVFQKFLFIYDKFINEIVPSAFIRIDKEESVQMVKDLLALAVVPGLEWTWDSTTCSKASKFVFFFMGLFASSPVAITAYYRLQRILISRVNDFDIQELLDFYCVNIDVRRFTLPDVFFDPEPVGALKNDLKVVTFTKFSKNALERIKAVKSHCVSAAVSPLFGIEAVRRAFMLGWSDDMLDLGCEIVSATGLAVYRYAWLFTAITHAFRSYKGKSVALVAGWVLRSAFARKIVANFSSLTSDEIRTLEDAIVYKMVFSTGSINDYLTQFTVDEKNIFIQIAERLADRIYLIRRVLQSLGGANAENDISLLFEVYTRLDISSLPLALRTQIFGKVDSALNNYSHAGGPKQLFALVLFSLVFFETHSDDAVKTSLVRIVINLAGQFEVPAEWAERFESMLQQQVPNVAKKIVEQNIQIPPENFKNCVKLIMKYAPQYKSRIIASIANVSELSSNFLEFFN